MVRPTFTALHLRYAFATGEIWKLVEESHEKYGNIVRLGPRHVWIADKQAMKELLKKFLAPALLLDTWINLTIFSASVLENDSQDMTIYSVKEG